MLKGLKIIRLKQPGSVSINQKKMRRYVKSLKHIVDFYNPQSGNAMSKKGEGLKY